MKKVVGPLKHHLWISKKANLNVSGEWCIHHCLNCPAGDVIFKEIKNHEMCIELSEEIMYNWIFNLIFIYQFSIAENCSDTHKRNHCYHGQTLDDIRKLVKC